MLLVHRSSSQASSSQAGRPVNILADIFCQYFPHGQVAFMAAPISFLIFEYLIIWLTGGMNPYAYRSHMELCKTNSTVDSVW